MKKSLQGLVLPFSTNPTRRNNKSVPRLYGMPNGPGDGYRVVDQGWAPNHIVALDL
jgi:hypothetical protein